MLKVLAFLVLTFYVLTMQGHAQTNQTHQAPKSDKPSPPVTLIVEQHNDSPSLQSEHEKHVQADIWIVHSADKDGYDKAALAVSFAVALIALFGVIYAKKTLNAIEGQLTEIRAASSQTDRMIEHAGTQAEAAKDAAIATKDAVELSRDTAKKQLRAYLCIVSSTLKIFDDGSVEAALQLGNVGQTPAYKVVGAIGGAFSQNPIGKIKPPPPDLPKATAIIPSGKEHDVLTKVIRIEGNSLIRGASDMIKAVEPPHYALFVFGRYQYRDIFKESHFLDFRLIWGGTAGNRVEVDDKGGLRAKMAMDSEGNDAD